jgi:hypothetical protein
MTGICFERIVPIAVILPPQRFFPSIVPFQTIN